MALKIAKYLTFSLIGTLVILGGAILLVDDDSIESLLGGAAQPVLSIKRGAIESVGGIANTVGGWTLGALDGGDRSSIPRVIQQLPPPPVPSSIATPVQTKSLAEVAAETQQLYEQRAMANVPSDAQQSGDAMSPEQSATPTGSEQVTGLISQSGNVAPALPEAETTEAPDVGTMVTAENAPPPPPLMADTASSTSPATAENPNTPAIAEQATAPAEPQFADPQATEGLTEDDLLKEVTGEDVASLPTEETDTAQPSQQEEDIADPDGEEAYTEGLKFYSGQGVERNFGKAAQFFMTAAERGHAGAQYNLGLMNYVGQTGGQDFANAAKWFQMAAESGHIQAQYNLGFLYYEGKGVQQDLKTAYGWIDRAAEQGYAKAIKARDALKKAMPEIFGS